MNAGFNFIAGLFNNAVQTVTKVNNLPVKAYKVRVNGNIAIIESLWESKLGCLYGTRDVRTIVPSKMQLNRLQKFGFESFVYED